MTVRILTSSADHAAYDAFVLHSGMGNLWQSLAWKRYQEALGKEVRVYAVESGKLTPLRLRATEGQEVESETMPIQASALVVIDRTVGGFCTWEIPRGPVFSEKWKVESGKCEDFLQAIIEEAKRDKCFALYLSPTSPLSTFHFPLSTRHIHPQATRVIDLTPSESDILAQMHQKGRYNIGVAKKSGVTIRTGTAADIEVFHTLLRTTAERDGFTMLQKSHYERFLSHLNGSFLLLAEYDGRAIAGLLGTSPPAPLHCDGEGGREGIYYYGASSYEHRRLMAPYLLQWEAMRLCKAAGCTRYDLLGIAADNAEKDDPWAGITDFKRKFGGIVISYPPEQMLVLRPIAKWGLEWKRRIFG